MMPRPLKMIALSCCLLAGCSSGNDEIQVWMDDQSKQVKSRVDPIIAPTKFVPQPYQNDGAIDPFSSGKMIGTGKAEAKQSNAMLDQESRRRREPLESYPLDAIKMVGSLSKKGQPYALLKADNLLHHVKVGDYIGQNFGKIIQITETEITLREIVQDASGEWIERNSSLRIN